MKLTEKEAWERIAEAYTVVKDPTRLDEYIRCDGMCHAISVLWWEDRISEKTKNDMLGRLIGFTKDMDRMGDYWLCKVNAKKTERPIRANFCSLMSHMYMGMKKGSF